MIVYTPIFYCAELQLAFNDKITREVADTLQYIEYFDSYTEEAEDDSNLFRDSVAPMSSIMEKKIVSQLLWYLYHHSKQDEQADLDKRQLFADDFNAFIIHENLHQLKQKKNKKQKGYLLS